MNTAISDFDQLSRLQIKYAVQIILNFRESEFVVSAVQELGPDFIEAFKTISILL